MKVLEWSQHFSHCKSIGIFPDAQAQLHVINSAVRSVIWSNIELIRAFMVVLVTCKIKGDPIKNEGSSVLTRLYFDFLEIKGI